jgi:hypothetical protein
MVCVPAHARLKGKYNWSNYPKVSIILLISKRLLLTEGSVLQLKLPVEKVLTVAAAVATAAGKP